MVKKMVLVLASRRGSLGLFPRAVQAEVEWKVFRSLDLKATPLDVAPSMDGQR